MLRWTLWSLFDFFLDFFWCQCFSANVLKLICSSENTHWISEGLLVLVWSLFVVCGFLSLVPLCCFNHFSFSLAFSYLSSLSLFWSSSPPPPPSDSEVLFWEMFEKLHRKLSADTESTGRQPINNSMNTEITLCTLLWPRVVTVQGPPRVRTGSWVWRSVRGQLNWFK